MNYTISRDGATLGVFDEAELREGVGSGRFRTSDYAWAEGMPDWKRMGEVVGLPIAATPPPLPSGGVSPFAPPSLPPRRDLGDDAGMRLLLPVGRSGWAIAAGYLGLFALLVVPAPLAVIVSIMAFRDIQKSKKAGQHRKHGTGRAIFGLLMGISGTVLLVYLVIFLLGRSS